MWGFIPQEKSPQKKRSCPPSQYRTLRPLFYIPRPFNTWRWPKRQLSFGAQPSFLLTGLLYPRCETFELDLRVDFCFSPIFWFIFPFGPRAIRYYSSTRTTAAVQISNSLESEEYSLFAVRSMHTSCCLHGPLSADVYMYSTRKHLHVKPFLLFISFHLWDLHWRS